MNRNLSRASSDAPMREVVAVFRSRDTLEQATEGLLRAGFSKSAVNIMADPNVIAHLLGNDFRKAPAETYDANGLETRFTADDSATATVGVASTLMYIGATAAAIGVVASGGPLVAAAAAAAVGAATGGGLSALLIRKLGWRNAQRMEQDIDSGGIVVLVRVRTDLEEAAGEAVLKALGAENVRVHEVQPTAAMNENQDSAVAA